MLEHAASNCEVVFGISAANNIMIFRLVDSGQLQLSESAALIFGEPDLMLTSLVAKKIL